MTPSCSQFIVRRGAGIRAARNACPMAGAGAGTGAVRAAAATGIPGFLRQTPLRDEGPGILEFAIAFLPVVR